MAFFLLALQGEVPPLRGGSPEDLVLQKNLSFLNWKLNRVLFVFMNGHYLDFMEQGPKQGKWPELVGGGLIRSLGGWAEVRVLRLSGQDRAKGDERIKGRFVNEESVVLFGKAVLNQSTRGCVCTE